MARSTQNLEDPSQEQNQTPAKPELSQNEQHPHLMVKMNYPSPILLSALLVNVAEWCEYQIVMEPSLDRPVQVFAPHRMTREQGFTLLVATLDSINLRIIELDASVIKIVPKNRQPISA